MWISFLLVIINCIMVVVMIIFLTVFEMLRLVFLSELQVCVFILPFYYTTLFLSCCEILF